jgi:putative transposase
LPEGATPTTITLSRATAGRYFVSFLLEAAIAPLPPTTGHVGIALGLQDMVVLDNGEQVGNPPFFSKDAKKLPKPKGDSPGSTMAPRTATRRVLVK